MVRSMNAEQVSSWRRAVGRFAVVLTAIVALGACAMTSEVFLRDDGSGVTNIDVTYSPELVALMQEVAEIGDVTDGRVGAVKADGDINDDPIYNRLNARAGVTVYQVVSPRGPSVKVAFAFENASLVLPPGIINVTRVADGIRARLYLDVNRVRRMPEVFPILNHPAIRAVGPTENQQTTKDEYLAMMGVLLGPEGAQELADSMITVRFAVDGELVSQRGGRIEDDLAVFEVPVIDLLLLHEPIDLEVVFR